jgi:hypothetical protein
VGFTSDVDLTFQWQFQSMPLDGQTNATLLLSNMLASRAGAYSVTAFGWHSGGINGDIYRVPIASTTNTLVVMSRIPTLFSTGLANDRAPLPNATVDPHWQLVQGPDSAYPGPACFSTFPGAPWLANDALSQWINPGGASGDRAAGDYVFRHTFTLTLEQMMMPSILARFFGDDVVEGVTVNGVPLAGEVAKGFSTFSPPISLSNLRVGSNTLDVVLRKEFYGPTALRVELNGYYLRTNSIILPDFDQDGLPDALELQLFGGNLLQSGADDYDGDGVINSDELAEGTNPVDSSSFNPRLRLSASSGYILKDPNLTNYAKGSQVSVTALPFAGGVFLGWTGDFAGQPSTIAFSITSNMSAQAWFGFPYNFTGSPVPGLVEAENFDNGEEGFAYHDVDVSNNGGAYRDTGVDIAPAPTGSAYKVGWSADGEWLNYTINAASNGIYRVELRVASPIGGKARLEFFGGASNTVNVPITGGYETWTSVTSPPVRLQAGLQILRMNYEISGFDFDYFRVITATSAPPVVALTNIWPGQSFPLNMDLTLAALASDSDGSVAVVEFYANGSKIAQASMTPFVARWRPTTPGTYTLTARAVDNVGVAGTSAPVTVTFDYYVAGGLKRDVYTNIAGTAVSDLTNHAHFPGQPDFSEKIWQFESPSDSGESYGARLSGFVVPSVTGPHRFYISSDDQSAFYLSTDASPANKLLLASEPAWNGYREYVTGQNQPSRGNPAVNISSNISLVAGHAYYVEGLLKEGTLGDHLSVAWLPPAGSAVTNSAPPVYGRYLAAGVAPASPLILLGASSLTNSGRIVLSFNHPIASETIGQLANYTLTAGTVTSALLAPDPRFILLGVTGLSSDTFTISVRNLLDGFGNSLAPFSEVVGQVLPQRAQDLGLAGDPLEPGVALPSQAGDFLINAGGSDIWSTADQFHFVHEQRSGDFDVVANIESDEAVNRWSKAGIMGRETLTAGSREVCIIVTPVGPTRDGTDGGLGDNNYSSMIRPGTGQPTASWDLPTANLSGVPYPNAWVRLKRQGNNFTSYRSSDGSQWILLGQTSQVFPATVYLGLATSAHNNSPGFNSFARYRNYGDINLLPPQILAHPGNLTLPEGANAVFSVSAGGAIPLRYQWRFNGTNITGATNGSLIISNIQSSNTGYYRVLVSNTSGLVNSLPAQLMVVQQTRLAIGKILGNLVFNLTGEAGQRYVIEYSTNLTSWFPSISVTNQGGGAQFQFPFPGATQGFYRARVLPDP